MWIFKTSAWNTRGMEKITDLPSAPATAKSVAKFQNKGNFSLVFLAYQVMSTKDGSEPIFRAITEDMKSEKRRTPEDAKFNVFLSL